MIKPLLKITLYALLTAVILWLIIWEVNRQRVEAFQYGWGAATQECVKGKMSTDATQGVESWLTSESL